MPATLPPKRTEDGPLIEKLTENAYERIIPARYLKRGKHGELIEEPEDLFERVAKNISVAEAVWANDPVTVTEDEIKPDHPRRVNLEVEVLVPDHKIMDGENSVKLKDEVELTEENAKWISYDRLVQRLEEQGWDTALDAVTSARNKFQEQMENLSFTPNSPTLMNAGNDLQQLSACFVISPEDDISEIHNTARQAAEVFQSGGGMGYGFWRLRPYGDQVGSTGGIASGPITFMRTYDQMCETIAQGGKRRGAQMGIMRVSHPDVIFFLHAKNRDVSLATTLRLNDEKDPTHTDFGEALEEARGLMDDEGKVPEHLRNAVEGHLSNFNISVGITGEFMDALQNGEEYAFKNPRTGDPHIATPETVKMCRWFDLDEYVEAGEPFSMPAYVLWDRIIEGAHENGEPGVIFIDRINEEHSFPVESTPQRESDKYEIMATNPCGEQPLMEYEACNLGHINLSTVVEESAPDWRGWGLDASSMESRVTEFLQEAIDFEELYRRVRTGTRFLDNVVTMSSFPIDKIEETVASNRKIGLGIMGLAQMYIQLGVEYGSPVANEIGRQVMEQINHESKRESHRMAMERGEFDNWEDSKYSNPERYQGWFEGMTGLDAGEFDDGYLMRNHNTTTIAPTGTTSMIGNTSGGCEPIPNVAYYKNVGQDIQGEDMLVEFDDYFLRVLESNGIDVEAVKEEAAEQMGENKYSGIEGLDTVPEEIGELFVVTSDLDGVEHGRLQCALQESVDSAISKTINAPNDATVEDTDYAFRHIYQNGGKGVTYYRDGSRSKQVITTRAKNMEYSDDDSLTMISCGCGDYSIRAPEGNTPSDFDIICPECGNHFGQGSVTGRKAKPRPKVTTGQTHLIPTSSGKMYVTINEDDDGDVHEVFVTIGKSGGFTESLCEALGRQISLSLRAGVDINEVIGQLENIRGPEVQWDQGSQINSIPDGIAKALTRYMESKGVEVEAVELENRGAEGITDDKGIDQLAAMIEEGGNPECPDCGSMLVMQEGCRKCRSESCGYSEC